MFFSGMRTFRSSHETVRSYNTTDMKQDTILYHPPLSRASNTSCNGHRNVDVRSVPRKGTGAQVPSLMNHYSVIIRRTYMGVPGHMWYVKNAQLYAKFGWIFSDVSPAASVSFFCYPTRDSHTAASRQTFGKLTLEASTGSDEI